MKEISEPALVRALATAATWERFNKKEQDWLRVDPPARHVEVLRESIDFPHLPILKELAHQPYLRQDSTLMLSPGYDPVSMMYGIFDPSEFPVPKSPTRAEAEAAFATFCELVEEFPFRTEADRMAAIAAFLTAAVRVSLPAAPMFHISAPAIGSGKSYLCKLIWAFATPQRRVPLTFPAHEDECQKLLVSELMRSPPVIEFDNLTGDLVPYKSLCIALRRQST